MFEDSWDLVRTYLYILEENRSKSCHDVADRTSAHLFDMQRAHAPYCNIVFRSSVVWTAGFKKLSRNHPRKHVSPDSPVHND
jgi:hypothetical protein